MPPKKKTISEEEFREYQQRLERKCQDYANQIQEHIETIKNDCREKIQKIEENLKKKLAEMERKYENQEQKQKKPINDYSTRNEGSQGTEITRPTFFGNNRDMHPRDFLSRLEEYFAIKQTYVGEKIIIIGDCLKSTAYNWFSTIRFQLCSYEDFRKAFIDEYWSREIQIQVWSQCLNVNNITPNTNYREHFATWATKLRHLEVPKLSEHEIVKHIAKHYPGYLRAILISLPERTILAAMKVLGEEEHTKEKAEPPITGSNQQQKNTNNWGNQRNSGWNNIPPRNNRWNNQPQHHNGINQQGDTQQPSQRQSEHINQVSTNVEKPEETNNEERHAINSLNTTDRSVSPYIQCTIEGEEITLLVDTGATVSVLTKELVDIITQKNPRIPQLPVTGVQISNAVGKKVCKVSKQIFCECKIKDIYIQTSFIQVENLNEKGIIGADILNKYSAQIKFKENTVQIIVDEVPHIIPFANKEPRQMNEREHLQNVEINENNPENDQITLSNQESQIFASLLNKYNSIFSDQPGKITKFQCQIKVKPGDPIYQRQYTIPISKIPKVDAEIQRMLDMQIIEKSTSPWSSPIVCIEKKNGDIRVCLDARKINTVIIPDRECPTNMEETLIKFKGMKYLSSIDLTAGYWQCPLKQNCREITAFLHRGRNYQFKVLPFGLINSVAEFQKILDQVLGPEVMNFAAVYVDDIQITSASFQEHMQHLETIFRKLAEHNITINKKKSQFLKKQVTFLGHVISEKGISMDPDKIQTIKNFQPPRTKKQVQSFLGFINFYRKFIRDLSQDTEHLSVLTKKKSKWVWNTTQQRAFEDIKQKFLADIIIQFPDFTKAFYLNTDASTTHLGAELYQINDAGQHQTLGFASRTLNNAEQNYSTTELELLAIVFACKKFRHYLLGHHVKILTDHHALTFLNTCQLLNSRLVRWANFLQEFQLEIKHIPGKENVGADTLTRYPQSPADSSPILTKTVIINKVTLIEYSQVIKEQFKNLHVLQQQDQEIQKLKQRMEGLTHKNLIIHNSLLFRRSTGGEYQIIIPKCMVKNLVEETHIMYGHSGTYKTYQLIQRNHQFKNMYRTIKQIVKTCDLCQKAKISNIIARGPTQSITPEKPREVISVDLMGPLPRGQGGCKYILALLDLFSKYIKLYPLKKATTESIMKRIVNDYIPTVGIFQKILTDNGTQFTSQKWIKNMTRLNIKIGHTTNYHPESNPVERANREIGRLLRTYCHAQHTNWLRWLDNIEYWINNTTHTTTGYTPNYVMFGKESPILPTQLVTFPQQEGEEHKKPSAEVVQIVMKRIKNRTAIRNQRRDTDKIFPTYQVGDKVLIKEHRLSSAEDKETHKLFLLYHGPYTIVEVHNNNTVGIKDNQGNIKLHNFKNIRKYFEPHSDEVTSPNK